MIGSSVMKKRRRSSPIILRKSVLTCCKAEFAFFSIWVLLHEYSRFTGQQGGYLFISFLPLPFVFKKPRHQPSYCCRKLSSAHSWQPDSDSVSNFQSMKITVELNTFSQNSFVVSPGLLCHLIRRDTERLANEAFTSNPIVSSKQQFSHLKITNLTGNLWFPKANH